MSCLVCGESATIKSHHPKGLDARGTDWQGSCGCSWGRRFYIHPIRYIRKNILCAECDNKLGVLENTAAKALRAIRKAARLSSVGEYVLEGVEGDSLLRFVTGGRLSEASPTCRMLSCERKILRSFLYKRGWYIRDGYRSSLTSSKENNAWPRENLNRLVTSIRSLCRPTTHFTPTLGLNVTLRYTLCN